MSQIQSGSSYLDDPKIRKRIEQWITKGYSNAQIARLVGEEFQPTSERSIRRAKKRWASPQEPGHAERPRFTRRTENGEDEVEIVGEPSESLTTPDDMARERGLDPEDWDIKEVVVNEWNALAGEGVMVVMRQLKVRLVRRKPEPPFIQAARVDGPSFRSTYRPSEGESHLVVFCGDQQAPFHNRELHELFCQWLERNEPHEGVLIGDTVDFPSISRHRLNPEHTASVQECVDAGYALLRDYVQASSVTRWRKLAGNHDERIRNALIDWATQLYGITKARIDEHHEEPPVLSIESLLRLDELGIEYVDPNGRYDQAQINLSKYLAARHGWITRQGSGASALKTLERLGHSIVIGHTHRQSLVTKTAYDIDGRPSTHAASECGCMCKIEEGLGYTPRPDWVNGFATAWIWADGTFRIDLGTFVNDSVLLWQDQRFSIRREG